MFEDMYIPWTPRLRRRVPEPQAQPEPAKPQSASSGDQVCNRTLHIARAIVAYATKPFPEIATAISNAFIAYIRGQISIDMRDQRSYWKVIEPTDSPSSV